MANKSKSSGNSLLNVIIAVIMIAVIGLAVYAVYDKMSAKFNEKAIANGEKEATVEYLANQQGMSIEDYLAQYGVSGISGKATQTELADAMTVDNYVNFASTTIEDLTTQLNLTEAPAGDTNWGELRKTFTVRNYIGSDEENFNQFKEMYKLDDTITLDTLWTDAEPIIEESIKKQQEEAANATPAPTDVAAEATEAPAENEAAEAPIEEAAE